MSNSSASPQLEVDWEDYIQEFLDEATVLYPSAGEVFQAAIWRLKSPKTIGDPIEGDPMERRLIFLPPNLVSRSPGLVVRFRNENPKHSSIDRVVDWIKFYDFDPAIAVAPPAYTIH